MKNTFLLSVFAGATMLPFTAHAAVVTTIDAVGGSTVGTDFTTSGTRISLADMQALITTRNDLTLAGVLDSEGVTTAGDFNVDPNYGTLKIGISGSTRYGRNDSGDSGFTSSGVRFGYINTGPETWTITAPLGGLVTHFGLTATDKGSDDLTVRANFSGGGSDTFTTSASDTYWIGFAAPSGQSITSLVLSEPAGGAFFAYDDVSFVATPEPGSLALLAFGGILGLRRKR